jgi:hypothetical protein
VMPIRYDVSAVRTLEAAVGRPATAHSWVISDTSDGRVKGIYATAELATEAVARLAQPGPVAQPGRLYVLTIVHPARCTCPEAPP